MVLSLMLDTILAVLLVVTISYAVVLNRKIGGLRRHRGELEKAAASFEQAIGRAEESVGKLNVSTTALQQRMVKAQELVDDLSFLIDRGEAAADRLENEVRTARKPRDGGSIHALAAGARPATARSGEVPRSQDEQELLRALASGH